MLERQTLARLVPRPCVRPAPDAPPAAERTAALRWRATGAAAWFAEAELGTGDVVYLLVECLGGGWEWLVWDAGIQALPRHGPTDTAGEARRQAERSMREVSEVLLTAAGVAIQGAPAWSDT